MRLAIDQLLSDECVVSIFLAYPSGSEPSTCKHIDSSRRSFASQANRFPEVLPKAGLVYSEKGNLSEVLCKPKLLPLKVRTIPSTSRVICTGCTCLLRNAKKAFRPSTRTAGTLSGNDNRRVDESFLQRSRCEAIDCIVAVMADFRYVVMCTRGEATKRRVEI